MTPGYTALREGAALVDLDSRGRFRARGEDRARLLHAMSTNHIQQLKAGEGCYAFFLNAQGRILSDAVILCLDDHFLLDVEPEAHDALFQHIDKYIIADDVTVEDAREDLTVIAVEGPASEAVLKSAGVPLPAGDFGHVKWDDAIVAKVSSTGAGGFRIYLPRPQRSRYLEKLSALTPATPEDARTVRLEHHKPRYGEDISDKHLVQETRQLGAMHFSKGCYLGQEIVERVRSRGQVHRLLSALVVAGGAERGTPLKAGEKDAGEITSAAWSPALGKTVALAYIRPEFAQPHSKLTAAGVEAEVIPG